MYSEVPNRQADRNKQAGLDKNATLLVYLLSKSINEQGGIFRLNTTGKIASTVEKKSKKVSDHACLLGTSK